MFRLSNYFQDRDRFVVAPPPQPQMTINGYLSSYNQFLGCAYCTRSAPFRTWLPPVQVSHGWVRVLWTENEERVYVLLIVAS
jgi:hypothetical protein